MSTTVVLSREGAVATLTLNRPDKLNALNEELLLALTAHLRTVTVLPPLGRRLGRLTPIAYPVLARVGVLHSHAAGVLVKAEPANANERPYREYDHALGWGALFTGGLDIVQANGNNISIIDIDENLAGLARA